MRVSRIRQKNKRMLFAVLMLASALLMSVSTMSVRAYEGAVARLPVKQEVTVKSGSLTNQQQMFEYELIPVTSGAPMPDGSVEGVYHFTLTGNVEREIQIGYDYPGQYDYHVRQLVQDSLQGMTYDTEEYTVSVLIKNSDGEQKSIVTVQKQSDGYKSAFIEFDNSYVQETTPSNPDNTTPSNTTPTNRTPNNAVTPNRPSANASTGTSGAGTRTSVVNRQTPVTNEEEPNIEKKQEVVDVDDSEVPRANFERGAAWALLNLILTILTALITVLLIVTYCIHANKNDEEDDESDDSEETKENRRLPLRLCSCIPTVAAVVIFCLTEDIFLPMRFVDKYTWLMAVIFVIQIIIMFFSKSKIEEDEEE